MIIVLMKKCTFFRTIVAVDEDFNGHLQNLLSCQNDIAPIVFDNSLHGFGKVLHFFRRMGWGRNLFTIYATIRSLN